MSNLRVELKQIGARISELRTELSMLQKANQLGCTTEELLGMKVDCPQEKLGMLIGKNGQTVKQLQEKENVSIDVARQKGAVHITGSLQSIDATATNIDRVLSIEEQSVELPKPLVSFLTSKGITVLSEIRARNPDVDLDISRTGESRLRGVPDDIQSAKNDIMSVEIVEQQLRVSSNESAIVVGKQGVTVNEIVERHQAAVEVARGEGEGTEAMILVRGSVSSVKDAVEEIEDLLAQHKEETQSIPIDPLVKDMLLMNKGVGMQALFKLVNNGCRDILPGAVGVSIEELAVKVKGKAIVMPKAVEIVSDELRLRESSIVRLSIHPSAIPALIGKGGTGIKKLREGNENVMVEVDRSAGQIAVGSYNSPDEARNVVQAVEKFLEDHHVKSVEFDPQLFQSQFRLLLRSTYWKELNELVSVSRDDGLFQLLLRGKAENLEEASKLLSRFLEEHHQDEISVSDNHLGVLLRGGKKSKIEEFAKMHEVKLNSDPEKFVVTVTGRKENVDAATKAIDCYLNGGDGVKVLKIVVDDSSAGILVGRGGSTKAAIESKFSGVSISIMRDQTVVIRGPESAVISCQKHIAKMLTMAFITEKEALDEQMRRLSKAPEVRSQLKVIPVQSSFEESQVTLRGSRADVHHALALLKSIPGSVYENRVFLEASCLRTLHNVSRDTHLARIQSATRTKIIVDSTTSSIIVTGKKENVVTAKAQLFQFLGVLLSGSFACEPLPETAQHLLGQPAQLGFLAEASGAFMYIDRDVGRLVVTAPESASVKKAIELLGGKLSSLDSTVYKLDLGVDADWLVPKLIGKNGARIKALRKSFECSVDIDGSTITLMNDDPAKLEKAKISLDEIIAEERAQCAIVELKDDNMSAFLGPKGAQVREFENLHNVRAQALRKRGGWLRITGNAEAVAKAKTALDDWLEQRGNEAICDDTVVFNFDSSEAFLLRRLIGKSGSRINALRKRCMCQIDIDVDRRILKISNADSELLEAARKIVSELLAEERSQNAVVQVAESDVPAFIGLKGSNIREFEQTHNVRVHVMKNEGSGGLHIAGEAEAVVKAREALKEWIARGDKSQSVSQFISNGDRGESVNVPPLNELSDSDEPKVQNPNETNIREMNEAARTPAVTAEKTDFPVLMTAQTQEEPATEGTIGKCSATTSVDMETTHSWASIVQQTPKEHSSSSTIKESDSNAINGDASAVVVGCGVTSKTEEESNPDPSDE